MKILKYKSIFILIISILSVTFIIKSVSSNKLLASLDSDELEDIENAIIIEGIKYVSNTPLDNYNDRSTRGMIIYNNSFNVSISEKNIVKNIEFDSIDKAGSKNTEKMTESSENLINYLKKKDKKWHLTAHTIIEGENLWLIAKNYKTNYKLIIKANDIKKPDILNPGNVIQIPNRIGVDHKIQKNETLSGIAKLYNIRQNNIIANNNIRKDIIKEDDFLFIPDVIPEPKRIVKSGKNYKDNQSEDDNEYAYVQRNNRIKFNWPLKGKISSAFGKRIDPISKRSRFHCGLDISADIGTPVKAAAAGKCIFSGWKKGYGRVVILKHDRGYITVYAHNKENKIRSGEKIDKSSIIALSGISGAVTGPHLHFEIRKYLTPLNPLRFIK